MSDPFIAALLVAYVIIVVFAFMLGRYVGQLDPKEPDE